MIISLVILASILLLFQRFLEIRYLDRQLSEQREEVSERLSGIRYQLESTLANNLSLINGLAAFITAYPDFTQTQFEQYAATVIAREPALVNLAAAPGLIVRYVYPAVGNEAAIGLNYMTNSVQREAVQRAVETGTMVIAGPFELVQGGRAFVGRAPVYLKSESGEDVLWGVVSSPMLVSSIYEKAGLNQIPSDIEVAIRGHDGVTAVQVFFGREAVFDHPGAVVMPVIAGGSTWEIAAVPTGSSASAQTDILALRIASLAAFLLLTVLLVLRYRQLSNNQLLRAIIFRNERFLRAVETVSRVGGWRWTGGKFTEVSEQAREIMQLHQNEIVTDMAEFCHSLDHSSRQIVENCIRNAARHLQRIDQEIELRRASGEIVWLHLKAEVLTFDTDQVELVGAIQDVSQQKKADQLIEYQANYDLMTGLPNRALFHDRLLSALLNAARRSTRLAVLFIDLDNFKSVNDNLGHDAGDELLVESAKRIKACIRSVDTVGRYSGDEFVALLVDVFSVSVAARIADNMVTAMREPFELNGRQVYCSVSIGVSFYPDDGDNPDMLLIKADQAMYEVKKSGRNACQFYTAAMQMESEHKHVLYNELVSAINNNQLMVYFQPVVNAASGLIVSCEALVRWSRSDGSWVAPDIFIPVAEERGLINRVDLFVLQQALQSIRQLNKRLDKPIGLSVNVSPKLLHLRDDDAQEWLRVLESENEVSVTIEITERVLIDEVGNTSKVLEQIHAAGVHIAIDDFGTGYSGLSYFSRFPVSAVKIDRSFVRDLGQRATQTTLVETILLLARKLGIQVVAEGVETEEQARILRENNCDFLQGYYISKPIPEPDFIRLVLAQQGKEQA
ncbi:MAG: EAL domain-containing protein [Pseudohongiella sp.]|nr:EAL domain-containing protein [Pseudohongiella sp.]